MVDGSFAHPRPSRRLAADQSFEGARTPAHVARAPLGRARVKRWLAAALSGAIIVGLCAQFAAADDLTDRRDALKSKLSQTKRDLNESSRALNSAAAAVDRTQASLASAQATLAATRQKLAAAQLRDRQMAARLAKAQADLAVAKQAVADGERALAVQKQLAGSIVRNQVQQQTNLIPIAILVESRSMADLSTRIQWSSTMMDTAGAEMARLQATQRRLDAARDRQAALEKQVAADRQAAAANLATTRALEAQAAQQAQQVAALLARQKAQESAAAADVAADKKQYADLTVERTRVEQRIAARIAAAKAAAARRAAAERAQRIAAEKAAAARRAKEKANRSSHSSSPSKKKSSASKKSSGGDSSGNAAHGFSYPVSAPITSPYGMRFHPILHYWKLHDGTDFGAGCGTAIHAPYSGRVAEKYYNAGYGNRLMIDHGEIDGRYVTTGYNHAIRYTVGVGDHVDKGEVIGYVGTTGFSTGCHLHLMVWLDGKVVNPMTWF